MPKAVRITVHIAALLPLLWLLWALAHNDLTANPIKEAQILTGRHTLTILLLSLVCTPLYRLLGPGWFLDLKRTLGLYAFAYASLHFINFLVLDYGFNLALIVNDFSETPYPIGGFAAYLILIPLAMTSTQHWQKRLGKRWKDLHRLVYLAAILGEVHFLWGIKTGFRLPVIYAIILLFLLALRLPGIRRVNTRCLLTKKPL